MKFIKVIPFFATFLVAGLLSGQTRYLDQVFTQASKTTIIYGSNYTVLPLAVPGSHTLKQPLVAQVYAPVGDTETNRPLVIYLHTGNFFPFPQNGSCGGALNDSSNVEFATRLAKMGYVVAVADYRLGWNPFAAAELTRRFTLINAAYRGVQDVRSCIRYFRKNVAENGNQFGIDPSKIVVWGQGTGGYLSLATAYLDKFIDIYTTSDPNKFKIPNPAVPGGFAPMVIEGYNGDVYGEQAAPGIVDAIYNAGTGIPIGDTLYVQNTPGYSSAFNLCVNMGGALGDSTWLDKGEMPLISYHVLSDFFAPCETDILNVPTATGPQPVVEVSGSCDNQAAADGFGNNDIFYGLSAADDPYGQHSISPLRGFYPFVGTPDNTSSPWEWTSLTGTPAPLPQANCTNLSGSVARAYIDTIIGFYAPRACLVLGLPCGIVGTKDLVKASDMQVVAMPNPANDVVTLTSGEGHMMLGVELYSISGNRVRNAQKVYANKHNIYRGDLPPGIYVAKIQFKEGVTSTKILFE